MAEGEVEVIADEALGGVHVGIDHDGPGMEGLGLGGERWEFWLILGREKS
jgi:hypothetical protein